MKNFDYDVFLAHSSKDKPVVRALAERLRADGLRVWLDEWIIQPGDSIPLKVSNGLEQSRVLLLLWSKNFFASEWEAFEQNSFIFRDPNNPDRRFIPLRLDECELPTHIAHFLWFDWRGNAGVQDVEYPRLLGNCRSDDTEKREAVNESGMEAIPESLKSLSDQQKPRKRKDKEEENTVSMLLKHTDSILSVSLSSDGHLLASGSSDKTIRLWEVSSGECLNTLEGHTDSILSVSLSSDGHLLASGSFDKTIRLWDVSSGECLNTLEGHRDRVRSISLSSDGHLLASCSFDNTIRLWEVSSGECLNTLEGHTGAVRSISLSSDGHLLASGSSDKTIRLWEVSSGECLNTLEGHTGAVLSVSLSSDSYLLASGSLDKTIRLWDVSSGECLNTLKGHTGAVLSVSLSSDGHLLASGSLDNTIRLWEVSSGECLNTLEGHTGAVLSVALSSDSYLLASGADDKTIRLWDGAGLGVVADKSSLQTASTYANARVLLVGDSGVGKSGIALRLTENRYQDTTSTDGVWATIVSLPENPAVDVRQKREVWLWDFAGQNDYRLLHQLFMDDAALVVLVFNPQIDNPFEGLGRWDRDIRRAAGGDYKKLLVAGRCDRGGITISRSQLDKFVADRGFAQYIETSAISGMGCDTLLDAIRQHIDWNRVSKTVSPRIFRRLKEEILRLRDTGLVLLRREELRQRLELALPDDPFTPEQFETVVGLLAGPGMVWKLEFGGFVLLRPEQISAYAGALVRTVRAHPDEIGCVLEANLMAGNLDYQDPNRPRLPRDEEEVILRALYQTLLQRGLCFQQPTLKGNLLVFPSLFRVERPTMQVHPPPFVSYRFSGLLEDIYATLVVRLHHSTLLDKDKLWRNAADFTTPLGQLVGIKITRLYEGESELTVYCDPAIGVETRVAFMRYIDEHIRARATNVARLRHYTCSQCHKPAGDMEAVRQKLVNKQTSMLCVYCEGRFLLWDEIEERFGSSEVRTLVKQMNQEADSALDTQSREQILIGEVGAIASVAGQIFRSGRIAADGIDGEIEFQMASGVMTGKRVFLQFKPIDHLRTMAVDESKMITFLEGLDPVDLTRVITYMDQMSRQVPDNIPHYERVAKMMGYVRGSVGPGINGLCKTLDILFPANTHQWLRSKRATDEVTTTFEVCRLPEQQFLDHWMANNWEVYLVIRATDNRVRWMNITAYLKRQSQRSKQIIFEAEEFTSANLLSVRDQM